MSADRSLKEVVLSDRMSAVAHMVTKGNAVCDVGCDHGFISIYLVKTGICPKAIAMDVRKGPLEAARKHVEDYALTDYIETRLSDGVTSLLPGEADTLICAGMGGKLMKRILEEGREKVRSMKEFILQPQSELQGMREYLREQGYLITDENMILEDGKYYSVIKVQPTTGDIGQEELPVVSRQVDDKYGPVLLKRKNPILLGFLIKERALCEEILRDLEKSGEENGTQIDRRNMRRREIAGRIRDIDAALSYMDAGGAHSLIY
ncbi:MAG: SAM-dependent methyltransferase [Clostridiales bacterium]|nr:SAM-dependent methyltransferase [Clostridiales bacterium]